MITRTDIEQYFLAEKHAGFLFACLGIAAVSFAVIALLAGKTPLWKGVAIPLILLGLAQAIAGYTVYKRSDAQRINNVYALDMNPHELTHRELPRMERVNDRFIVFLGIEIAFLVTAIMTYLYHRHTKAFWVGFAIALLIEALIMLTADIFAKQRAAIYTKQLKTLVH